MIKKVFIIITLFITHSIYSGVCEDRKDTVSKAVAINNSEQNYQEVMGSDYKLIVLGEPHGTHYLEKLPAIISLFDQGIRCAFIEQPYQLKQVEIDQLLKGHKTEHFQTDASFDYVPFLKYLRDHNIKIIPVDNRLDHADGISALDYMVRRDDGMYKIITKNIKTCGRSLFVVGKHHLTPDISGYNKTLGHRLKDKFKEKVKIIDMIAGKNMNEEYCSYSQNNLFDSKNVLLKGSAVGILRYSTFVTNSFWHDFDYVLHLNRNWQLEKGFD